VAKQRQNDREHDALFDANRHYCRGGAIAKANSPGPSRRKSECTVCAPLAPELPPILRWVW
jgi:hypothetical protein